MDKLLSANWSSVFSKSLEICHQDEAYEAYSVREKMLAFIYTFLQSIQENEQEYKAIIKENKFLLINSANLNELKYLFVEFCNGLIVEGTNSGEIQARPVIANTYIQLLWNSLLTILLFWSNDSSEHKENTDVMVEKTVHFAFDLMAPNAIDSGLDMLQHLFKLRNKR